MNKISYNCPHEQNCPLHKHCRAITVPREITEPVIPWLKCPQKKKETGGWEPEILVEISAVNRAA